LHERPSGKEETRALLRAYPTPTQQVAEYVASDNDDVEKPTFYDSCQDSLYTLHKVMRIAFQDGETWLVEMLELERESVSARAAQALRDRDRPTE
jgi:hypothetical protein